MKWFIGIASALAITVLAVGVFYKPPVKAVASVQPDTYSPQYLLKYLNKERASVGVPPLKLDDRLNASAQAKADDMVKNNYYDHVDKNGQRIRANIKGCDIASENLTGAYYGQNPIKRWNESPSHKATQLNPKNEIVGFGSVVYQGLPVYVAHFCDL